MNPFLIGINGYLLFTIGLNSAYTIAMRTKRNKLTDEKLISYIANNARQSAEQISKKLQVSATTVRRRLKTAVREGIMRNVALVDPDKAGLAVQAVLGFNVSRDNFEITLNYLERQPAIKWLAAVTGEYDIVARAAFTSFDELSAFLRDTVGNIKGINNAESFICLETPKGRYISLD